MSRNQTTLECVKGDITRQTDLDCIVNAANAMLRIGGGVAGAVHRAAGTELEEACKPLAPIQPGQAVITPGFKLPNKKVIHCLGPVYGIDKPSDRLLADCYMNALRLADEESLSSIGFPSISTGAFGYPVEEAAEVVADTIHMVMPELQSVSLIRLILFSEEDYEIYTDALGIK